MIDIMPICMTMGTWMFRIRVGIMACGGLE